MKCKCDTKYENDDISYIFTFNCKSFNIMNIYKDICQTC